MRRRTTYRLHKPDPTFEVTPDCHVFCVELSDHTRECIERQARRITDRQAQPTGDHGEHYHA